jgi:hypothetical protein
MAFSSGIGASSKPVGSPPITRTPCAAAQRVKVAICLLPAPLRIADADA